MQDYVTVSAATISLTMSIDHRQEEQVLQETMVTLRGTKNLRQEANSSSQAVVCTVAPAHGGRDRRIERVRVADLTDCLGDGINIRTSLQGRLVLTWMEEGGGAFLTIEAKAKRSLWELYRQIQQARGVTPDENCNPSFTKTGARAARVPKPTYKHKDYTDDDDSSRRGSGGTTRRDLSGVIHYVGHGAESVGGAARSAGTSPAMAGGGGRRPSNGERQVAAQRKKDALARGAQGREPVNSMRSTFPHRFQPTNTGTGDQENRRPPRRSGGGLSGNPAHARPRGQQTLAHAFRQAAHGGSVRQDGMANLGNTCYMSAVLQALLRLPSFVHDLRACLDALSQTDGATDSAAAAAAADAPKAAAAAAPAGEAGGLLGSLVEIVEQLQSGSVVEPQKLKALIAQRSPQFAGHAQHDAHEFLTELLDLLQAELKRRSPTTPTAARGSERPLCPTTLNFRTVLEHRLVCRECGQDSRRRELYHDLSLDLPKRRSGAEAAGDEAAVSIQELLERYFQEEEIEYKCEHCKSHAAVVHKRLVTLPRVLILHLKRFDTMLAPPERTPEGGAEGSGERRWVAIKRPDQVQLDHEITLRPHCEGEARVALPSEHKPDDETRAREQPQRRPPLGAQNSSAGAHRDDGHRSSSDGTWDKAARRRQREDEDLQKAMAASLAESQRTPVAAAAAGGAEGQAIELLGTPEEDEEAQLERAMRESLESGGAAAAAAAAAVADGDDHDEPAAKRTRSNSPDSSTARARPQKAAADSAAEEPWLPQLEGEAKYSLQQVVSHFGSHADVGHYTTTIKLRPTRKQREQAKGASGPSWQWREYNDSTSHENTTGPMIDSKKRRQHGYLAVYVLASSATASSPASGKRKPKRSDSGAPPQARRRSTPTIDADGMIRTNDGGADDSVDLTGDDEEEKPAGASSGRHQGHLPEDDSDDDVFKELPPAGRGRARGGGMVPQNRDDEAEQLRRALAESKAQDEAARRGRSKGRKSSGAARPQGMPRC